MTRFKQFIQHWWRLLVIILILGALLYTWRLWLPVLQAWLLSTKDTLGSWADPMTTVLGIFAILGILWAIFKWALPSTQAIAVAPNNQNPPTSSILITPETIEQLLAKRLDAAVDLDADSKAYLTALVDLHRRLPMTGMGVNNLAVEFELLDLYVPLKASVSTPEGETWSRSMRLAGRLMSADEVETIGERQSDPVSLVQLLRDHAGVIILGDPGSGKSTFMKMLALRAALNQQAELGIGERIPFLLPLSEFANALEKQDTSLSQCIGDFWRSRSPNLRVDALLDSALAQGKALVLLDGLDEVRQPALRKRVVDLTTHFFAHHQQKGNKFVLTSRIVGYREVRPGTVGLQECTIVDFGREEIGQFVSQWTTAVANLVRKTATLSTWDAERERSGMMQTVERNAGVRQLASNPLLLTILALMKRSGIELPERRADLYETYIKTLLKSWNMARSLGKPLTSDLDEVETLRRLSPLALWMHEVSPGVGVVEEEAMKRKLSEICSERGDADPEKASLRLLADVHVQSSLLLERGHRQYGFIHTTFQEYLAARAVAQQGQKDRSAIVKALSAHIDDPNWREVSLLTIGYIGLVQQNDEVASAVIDDLLSQVPGAPGQAIVLAGECVADVGQSGITPACRQKVIEALTATITNDKEVPAIRRVAAGRILAHRNLGDTRPAVMTLEGMEFCYVPEGPFLMGSVGDDPDAYADEKTQYEHNLDYAYWIGRFPVSNSQYDAFVQAGGYENPDYWLEAAQHNLWKEGKVQDVWYKWNDDQTEVLRNLGGWRNRPVDWGEPYSLKNHPVTGINWYESLAFCRWLTVEARKARWLRENWQFTLPNEPEWEKAARGGLQLSRLKPRPLSGKLEPIINPKLNDNKQPARRFPFDDKVDPEKMNYKASNINATSVLGAYPNGDSPYKVEEMAGSVLEWTRSLWGSDANTPEFVYPYENPEAREKLNIPFPVLRVLRGGSWYHNEELMRCSLRNGNYPDNRYDHLGVRVVCVPIPSGL